MTELSTELGWGNSGIAPSEVLWHDIKCTWPLWVGAIKYMPTVCFCETRLKGVFDQNSSLFSVSDFILKSFIHLNLIVIYVYRYGSNIISIILHIDIQFSQHYLLKLLCFIQWMSFFPPWQILDGSSYKQSCLDRPFYSIGQDIWFEAHIYACVTNIKETITSNVGLLWKEFEGE